MLFSAHIPNCDISLQLFTELVNKFYWIEYENFYLTYHSINFWIHHSRPRHHLHLAPYTKHPLNFCSYRPPILLPLRNPIQHPISMTNDYYSSWSNCLLYMPFRSRPPYLFIYIYAILHVVVPAYYRLLWQFSAFVFYCVCNAIWKLSVIFTHYLLSWILCRLHNIYIDHCWHMQIKFL